MTTFLTEWPPPSKPCQHWQISAVPSLLTIPLTVIKDSPDASTESSDTRDAPTPQQVKVAPSHPGVKISGLQYHINIVLPESRDQMVYDSIFKSMREYLG